MPDNTESKLEMRSVQSASRVSCFLQSLESGKYTLSFTDFPISHLPSSLFSPFNQSATYMPHVCIRIKVQQPQDNGWPACFQKPWARTGFSRYICNRFHPLCLKHSPSELPQFFCPGNLPKGIFGKNTYNQ